jgi:hypothetical protein
MITLKLTVEELQLLHDMFQAGFAPKSEGNEDCDALAAKLSSALVRAKK